MPWSVRPVLVDPENRKLALVQLPSGRTSLIDRKHAATIGKRNWHEKDNGYVAANGTIEHKRVYLHRLIAELAGISLVHEIDHKNGDRLDNRESNLRSATPSENNRTRHHNTGKSGARGVSWNEDRKKWLVRVKINGKSKFIGWFSNVKIAAAAARHARARIYGEP